MPSWAGQLQGKLHREGGPLIIEIWQVLSPAVLEVTTYPFGRKCGLQSEEPSYRPRFLASVTSA